MLYSGDLSLWDYTAGNYIPTELCWISSITHSILDWSIDAVNRPNSILVTFSTGLPTIVVHLNTVDF